MATPLHHRLHLTGGCNFRDLGGYTAAGGRKVRRGLVYRSGVLTYLTAADHRVVAPLGIRTIVDLRREDEIAAEPTAWIGPVRIVTSQLAESIASMQRTAPWENSTTADEARTWMIDSYSSMQDWLTQPLRGIFEMLLDDRGPLLFHCAAGKDRTGFCAAIVLGLVGVEEETILYDYALTDTAVDLLAFTRVHRAARMGLTDGEQPFGKMAPDVRDALMRADPAYLKSALESLTDNYGSIDGYARAALGLGDAEIAAIRQRLLEV